MSQYVRGSEWRRWDLHIHTPGTIKNDSFDGHSIEEKWNKFYLDIENYIGDGLDPNKNISAIGITDYLSIDNYKKIIADNRLPKSIKLILPNIEMRIQPIAGDSPVNLHFIFEPQFIEQIDSRFFSKIIFPYGNTNFTAHKTELIRLGKTIDDKLNDIDAYKKGIGMFVVSFDAIKNLFDNDSDLRKNVLIGVSNSTTDGVSGATNHSDYIEQGESQLKAFRQSIYKFVDFIFSATPSDITYFLGKKQNCSSDLVTKECGSLKACIHGCDAHSNNKIFEPDKKRYCWIKADPTFNGLKQIVYEPEERVKISENLPETKSGYYVIDRLEFDDPDFQKDPIYFNDKLTCIIGGKSTGKSILIQNLARAIDKVETEKNVRKANSKTKDDIKSLKVFWADGKEEQRKIIYIPQTYLNKLSDEKEEKTEIDNWIQEILFKKPELNEAYNTFLLSIKEFKANLEKDILDLFTFYDDFITAEEKKREVGDKVGIEHEINKLQNEKNKLTKELELSEDEVKSYDNAIFQVAFITQEKDKIFKEKQNILSLITLVEPKRIEGMFSNEIALEISTAQERILKESEILWENIKNKIIENIDEKIKCYEDKIKTFNITVESLKNKIESSVAIKELTKKVQDENAKLTQFLEIDKLSKELNQKIIKLIIRLSESVNFYYNSHNNFANIVNENKIVDDGLEFYVEAPFRKEAFVSKFFSIFDTRTTSFKEIMNPDNFTDDNYTNEKIKDIIIKTINKDLLLKASYTTESALREILSDWYNTVYRVKMDDDPIDLMSPGKKALVLLKILVSLAESNCPILIDQPEDDLDNRSIYEDLIKFIKKKKKERQIIIVTHNANIVLGSDAEEIIVANQLGTNTPNNKYRFEYRSGSIENNLPIYTSDGVTIEHGILNSHGIQQHICDVLEGGKTAFEIRKNKYRI